MRVPSYGMGEVVEGPVRRARDVKDPRVMVNVRLRASAVAAIDADAAAAGISRSDWMRRWIAAGLTAAARRAQ